jgi:hypothetical protein
MAPDKETELMGMKVAIEHERTLDTKVKETLFQIGAKIEKWKEE